MPTMPTIRKRLRFFAQHWKLGVHLLFRTRRFGVNDRAWVSFDSMFGVSKRRILCDVLRVKPIIDNWKRMKFRAKAAYFVSDEEYLLMFGKKRD